MQSCTLKPGEFFFKQCHSRTKYVLTVGEHVLDIRMNLVFYAGLLGRQVNELHLVIAGKPAPPKNLGCWFHAYQFKFVCHLLTRASPQAYDLYTPSQWHIKLLTKFTHPANLSCRYAYHERIGWHVPVELNRPCSNAYSPIVTPQMIVQFAPRGTFFN